METLYRNFFRDCYQQTGGYFPTAPLNRAIFPGDFFQVNNGMLVILGNIFRDGVVDAGAAEIARDIQLSPYGWVFSNGVSKTYSGRDTGEGATGGEFQFSKQLLTFKERGSFNFSGIRPEAIKIINWGDLAQQLIIKLTQTLYAFREVYVVTESVSVEQATLAISGAPGGELEIATTEENFGLVNIFGHVSARTIQSANIDYYHCEEKRKPAFFRAKKLVVREERKHQFLGALVAESQRRHEWYNGFFAWGGGDLYQYLPHGDAAAQDSLLDMLPGNTLNPNTALQYFTWAEAKPGDMEQLFLTYENIC